MLNKSLKRATVCHQGIDMLEKISAHLVKALQAPDLESGLALFEHLFNLRGDELTPALIIDHLGVLQDAPGPDSPMAEFFQSVDQALANAYHALEPRRVGGLGVDVQIRSVLHFKAMGCEASGDIAFSRVETGAWGADHFKELVAVVGEPSSWDFVSKMAERGGSWRGLRSDFVAVLGLYMAGRVENPFRLISPERVEAVADALSTMHSRGQGDRAREAEILGLCRHACRDMSDSQYITELLDNQMPRQILMHAHPELREKVFGLDLGL